MSRQIHAHLPRAILISLVLIPIILISSSSQIAKANSSSTIDIESVINQLPYEAGDHNNTDWTIEDYSFLLVLPPNSTLVGEGENPSEWYASTEKFADWKKNIGLPAAILSNYTDYPGVDEPEKLRNAIKSYYNTYNIEWVLLLGDTNLIPIRYVYNPDTPQVSKTFESTGDGYYKPTDFYYAELSSNWDIDGDGNWGEDSIYVEGSDESELDYKVEVYVGRFPARNYGELSIMMNKTISYEQANNTGDWMNQFTAVTGISTLPTSDDPNGEHEYHLAQNIIDNQIDGVMNWTQYYEYDAAHNSEFGIVSSENVRPLPEIGNNMNDIFNNGSSIVLFAGHGAPDLLDLRSDNAFDVENVGELDQNYKYSFLFADACSTSAYDIDGTQSIGETFIRKDGAGGIGFVGSMRVSWFYPDDIDLIAVNRGFTRIFFEQMFQNQSYQQGRALYDAKYAYSQTPWQNSSTALQYIEMERKTFMGYMLLGDPSVDIYTGTTQNFSDFFQIDPNFYEGAKIITTVKDFSGNIIPFARMTLFSENESYYKSFVADENGTIEIKLPYGQRNISYSMFGHNMNVKNGTISISEDNEQPGFTSIPSISPNNPVASDNILVSMGIHENKSQINEVFILFCTDGTFKEFACFNYTASNILLLDYENFTSDKELKILIPKLYPADYHYEIVVFDNADNYNTTFTLDSDNTFTIEKPWIFKFSEWGMYGILIVGGISITAILISNTKKGKELPIDLSHSMNGMNSNPTTITQELFNEKNLLIN